MTNDNGMEKIKVVIGIDVETDVGSWTPYYQGVKESIPLLLKIFKRQKVKATFFFTGEAANKYPEKAKEVLKAGHEVGCHSLFHETVGDELFPIPGVKPLLPEEVPLRLQRATEMVEQSVGVRPVSFRAPRLWGSTAMVKSLENLGYKADATYPLYFHRKRVFPYHPNRTNWLKEGESNLLEIPVFADITRKSTDPFGRDLDHWPVFRTKGHQALMKMAKNFVGFVDNLHPHHTSPLEGEDRGRREPVLCFYFHPWEFISLPKKFHYGEGTVVPDYFLIKNCGPQAAQELEHFLKNLKQTYQTEFLTAAQLAESYAKKMAL